jgi:hypothetical protein
MKEKQAFHINGYLGLVGLIVIIGIGSWGVFAGSTKESFGLIFLGVLLWIIAGLFLSSLTIVGPNKAKAVLFFWKVSWNHQSKRLIHYNAVDAKNPGVFEGKKFQ